MPGSTVAEVLAAARTRYGEQFVAVLAGSRVWLNGEPAHDDDVVGPHDEVAVLPPVSGGAVEEDEGRQVPGDAEPDGPHVRLGLLWALATTVAAVLGPVALALWLAPAAALAALQASRTWRRAGRRPPHPLVPVVPFVLAAAAPVSLRVQGFPEAFALLAMVWAYDAGRYLVGTGAVNRWEGPAAGVAAVLSMSLAVAAALAPPFEGVTPWAFGVLVAATAPFADRLVARVVADRRARLPIVRRLDTLAVAGPPFAVLALLVLR